MAGGRVNHGRVIVEGYIDFDYEITQLTVRAIDRRRRSRTYFCEPIGHVQVEGDYVESWQPQPMSPLALERSREVAHKVTAALGGRGIFGVELFVHGDDVWFSEVSPRPHDTGLVTLCSQRFSEFELHARAILGLPVDTSLRAPGASAVIYGGLEEAGIAFEGVAAGACRAERGPAPVRQAGELRQAPHGRGARHRREHRRSPLAREAGRGGGAAGVGEISHGATSELAAAGAIRRAQFNPRVCRHRRGCNRSAWARRAYRSRGKYGAGNTQHHAARLGRPSSAHSVCCSRCARLDGCGLAAAPCRIASAGLKIVPLVGHVAAAPTDACAEVIDP